MTAGTRLCLVALLVVSSSAARAQDPVGLEIGLRAGYGVAFGKFTERGTEVRDGVAGQIPLILDLGLRVVPNVFVGLFGHYGFGIIGDQLDMVCDVPDEVSCSAIDLRLGIQAQYRFQPGQQLDPWVGFGIGYEWLTLATESGGLEFSSTVSGFEFFSLQGGLDIGLSEYFRAGPFISLSLAQYGNSSVSCSGAGIVCDQPPEQEDSISDRALHEWLILGVRVMVAP